MTPGAFRAMNAHFGRAPRGHPSRRTVFAADVETCPRCAGPMRWTEVATSRADILLVFRGVEHIRGRRVRRHRLGGGDDRRSTLDGAANNARADVRTEGAARVRRLELRRICSTLHSAGTPFRHGALAIAACFVSRHQVAGYSP